MSAADTVARMLALIPWLLERPGASVQEAAEAFGVSPRTILEDLDTVGYCGLPGLGGGDLFEIDLYEDRIVVRMPQELEEPLRLTPREALRLLLAGEAVSAALAEEVPALRSALDTLRRSAGVPTGVSVELDDDGTVWLRQVRDAIRSGHRLEIEYRSRGADAPAGRTVHPWALQVTEGEWYLRALDERSEETRTFRLDRIASLDVRAGDAVTRPEDDDPAPPRYEPGPDDTEVELVLPPSSRWIAEEVRANEVEEADDGTRRVVFHTDALNWVVGLLLAAGPGVRIVRPRPLQDRLRRAAREALARYSNED